jgi:hypothetical protein
MKIKVLSVKAGRVPCINCGWPRASHMFGGNSHDSRIDPKIFSTPKIGFKLSLDNCSKYEPAPQKSHKVKGVNIPPRGSHLAAVERPVIKR